MDLGTMAQKVQAGEYTGVKQLRSDFKLVISNCRTYNRVGVSNEAGQFLDAAAKLELEGDALFDAALAPDGDSGQRRRAPPKVFVAGSASGRTKPRADTEQPSPAPRPPASSPRKKKQPSSSAAPKVKSDVFEECPHCPPGSGKAKGHKGRHVAKAKAKATLPDGHKPRPAGRAPKGKRWDGTGWVSAGTGEGEAKRPPAPQPGAPRKAKLGSGLSAGASAATAAAQPPKALNAYALFGAEQRAKGDLPRGAVTEQSKVIGQRWRDVSPGHKARLEEQAKAQKAARQAWLATDTGKAWAEADKVTKQENKRKKEEQELEKSAKMSAEASWIAARRKDKKVRLSPSPTPQHLTMPAEQ